MNDTGAEVSDPQSRLMLLLSHGEKEQPLKVRNFSYYCLLEKRNFPINIPESVISKSDLIFPSCDGWLVLKDRYNYTKCVLLNLHSFIIQKIKLPDIPHGLIMRRWSEYFIMTAPPTAPNCILILHEYRGRVALLWRPGQQYWINLQLSDRYELEELSMSVCNQKIYGILASKNLVACDIVENTLKITILGQRPSNKYKKGCKKVDYLVGSENDIFWVQLSNPPLDDFIRKVNSVDVFKFDSGRWIWIKSIGDRVFFLNGAHSFAYSTTSGDIKANCIHYTSISYKYGNQLHTYDMTTGNIEIANPCSIPYDPSSIPQFVVGKEPTILVMSRRSILIFSFIFIMFFFFIFYIFVYFFSFPYII